MSSLSAQHRSLARSYLRHLSRFPDPITRAYLLNILHQRCRRPHGSTPAKVEKRIEKTRHFIESVRLKIAAANSGHVNIFEDLLKEAFARTGQRREQFMKAYAETAAPNEQKLPYPSSEFPTYPPALVALLTSPEAYAGKGRPTKADLQSIPPGTLITNTWSDLPPESQPLEPPKAAHMGMLHQARQINHRRWLRDRWLAVLIGPPLSAPPELENCLPPRLVKLSQAMLSELEHQVRQVGPLRPPRFSPQAKRVPRSQNKPPLRPPAKPPIIRIPAKIVPTHPLYPSPVDHDPDPLAKILPKRQRPQSGSKPADLSRGPRRVTKRFVRRRYKNVAGEIPLLEVNSKKPQPDRAKNLKRSDLIPDPTDQTFVDRNWITPDSDRSGEAFPLSVRKFGPGLGSFKPLDMSDEDASWMP